MSTLEKYKHENELLQLENQYLRESKLALIKATANEMERLRRFIILLSNALRGQGFTSANIRSIERNMDNNKGNNNRNVKRKINKKETEWKYKQKQREREELERKKKENNNNNNNNNIKSEWYKKDSIDNDEKKSKPMSLKERMNALQSTQNTDNRVSQKIEALKQERDLTKIKGSSLSSKANIASLFADKIEKQKKSQNVASMTSEKGKILKQALQNEDNSEKAAEIVESLGLFIQKDKTPDFKKKSTDKKEEVKEEKEEKLEVLNMNNNVMMKKMSEKEKENMENLICDALIKNEDLNQVQMCNADINDTFLTKILNKLENNRESHNVKELWLESNPISDKGMQKLAKFMENDDKIEIIKLYNNKKTISTAVLNELLDGLSKNTTITKFVFDGFRFQHQKDKKEKYLRRNAEIARKKRNEERKRLKQMEKE